MERLIGIMVIGQTCHFPQITGTSSSINELNTHPYSECIWPSISHIFGSLVLITINIRATYTTINHMILDKGAVLVTEKSCVYLEFHEWNMQYKGSDEFSQKRSFCAVHRSGSANIILNYLGQSSVHRPEIDACFAKVDQLGL